MKHLKLFFALFAMLALGIGNAWAQTVTWEKATSITAGDVVALVCESKKMELSGISTTSTKYGIGVAYTLAPVGKYELTVEEGKSSGTFSFKTSDGKYLYWSSGNSLTTNATKSANSSWTVTFSNNNAVIKNANTTNRQLQWNASSPRFACYDNSGQTPVQLYKKVISEESEDVIVKTLESIEVTPKTINYETGDVFKFDGTCTATYSVTKNGEPQDDETAVVTPTTVSTPDMSTAGTKEITVTYTENGVTVTDTYEINVTENVVTPGTYTGNLNNVFFGCATGNNDVEQSGKFDDVLVVAGCKSSASDKTNYQSGHVRFYKDSYLQLSVPAGYVIKSIVFTADGTWNGSITASAGTYDNNTKTWTGNAQEVKFSFAAQNRIKSVKVTYAADVKYAVNITTPSNGTLVVKEGETEVTSGATFPEGTKLSVVADPAQGYKLDGVTVVDELSNDVTDDVYADGVLTMPAYNITISAAFSVNEKPAATLTLSKNGVEELFPGSWKQDDVVTLPSITSDCVKEFVGWSADDNCETEPEYKAGDEYTLASPTLTQKLYAVYATVQGGGEATASVDMATYAADNGWTNEKQYKSLQIDANVTASVTGGGNTGKYYTSGNNWRLYQTESATITISTTLGELKSVKFTFTNSSDGTLLYNSTALTSNVDVEVSGNSAVFTVGDTHATENKGQIRISKIEVVYTGGVTYSDYSTTCSAALANPTFSLKEGKYTEAKSVEITATEGTVYYTTDGTIPTVSSTQYTGAIALNDCGEYTIKAIAISSDSQSDVVSATYTIKLPLTNSQAAPYTEAEAIAVCDGDCYDNQDVYVKGTVKTASFYSASGTYTITLTNGFQFYKFYKDGSKTLFTDGEINVGDVLVACGKLSKYNTTYQLAEGCYLVEHTPYEGEKTDISNSEATAYTVDQAFALIADPSSDLTKEVYVKGLVAVAPTSNPTADGQMTYKISDNGENTGNVLTVYLGLNLNGEKFTSKNDVQQGDYVVVKGQLLDYNGTYELNKGNQLVQHKKAATITIADITMEVGETKTIAATITPAGASVTYAIKAGSDNCITLNVAEITATAAGTATIVATIAETADYLGATKEFTVTVTAVDTRKKAVSPSPFTEVSGNMNPNDITYSSSKGGGTGGPNIKDNYIQLYQIASGQSYGGFITFNAVKGCKIDQVKIVTGNKTTTHIAYSVDDVMSAITENVQKNAEYLTEAGLNAESVNIYCMHTNSDNRLFIASAIVYYTGQPLADPELSWTSNAVELQVGETFTAPRLNNHYNVTGITYSSNNESLAKVNETTGVVTLVPDATGTATITAKFDGNETYKAANVSYTITVKSLPVSGLWELVTNVNSLAAGDKVVIVAKKWDYALSTTQNDNNRGQAAVTKNNDNTVAFGKDVQVLTLETGTVDNTFALNTGNGYLYASSTSANQLKTQKAKDANASWKITITDGTASIVAQGTSTRNTMQYNQPSSLFACYGSASQNALCIYKKNHVKVSGDLNSDQIKNSSDVTVLENGTLTVNNDIEIENLYIKTTMGTTTSGQISGATLHNLTINGDAFIDITLGDNANPQKWHAFTVPFPVDAMNGVYDLNDNQLKNEVNYAIMDYHGDIRANGQYGWKKYRGILVPGTFYLMTVDGARTTYRFKKVKDAALVAENTKSLSAYTGGGKNTDHGWNGVGNPTLMHGKVAYDAQILDPQSYTYVTVPASSSSSSAHFTVGTPFFIQAAEDGEVTINAEGNSSLAPARRATTAVEKIKVMLGNADYTDHLYVSASEDATNEYEIGKDLVKMVMTNTPIVPQIFAEAYGARLCMVNAPMTSNEATVALNLYAPAEGEYTLSVEEQADATVYLLYNGNIVWNLSMSEYPIQLSQGDNAGYSLVVRRENAPTDVENILGADEQTEKFIYNGKLYILHEDKVFNTVGNMLK